ncbi:ATP-binding protein [Phreatobacter sp.]|uniref:ATP-dependent nuclease n=1 Tax=Phreatobacter sp. TaxID=1966341 RepID=UPI0022CAAE91|nr:ATP-binding protein [Phreatobacter sp.]MCZ8314398.1 ATP-binding protein [Phreatobacter sp.]
MAVIRKIEIRHFRGIASLDWCPSVGINCLIGPGDSCKTTILDAIDLCLSARRNLTLNDSDFHNLNVATPITISITVGALGDNLKNLESYGLYLRGFDPKTGDLHDEPDTGLETVLTLRLTVAADLEPSWTLVSDRAEQQGQSRGLGWTDRASMSPTRLGAYADQNLSWGRASILNKISDETIAASTALADLARNARNAFGQQAEAGLPKALATVQTTAIELGVPVGGAVKAMLDAQSVSFSGGTISLHGEDGVPLKSLGLGSKRLLIAGLQRAAAATTPIVLVDEIEHGLEPHRVIRLIDALGAKEAKPPLQTFLTSHSPVAVRELSANQLYVVRSNGTSHLVHRASDSGDVQGTIRLSPDALLARSVLVCEGATEIGLIRGIDQFRATTGAASLTACGAAIVDGGGENVFKRARAFQLLGYRTAVLHDSDKIPTPDVKAAFEADGSPTFAWQENCSTEEELFLSLSDSAALALLENAVLRRSDKTIDDQIRSACAAKHSLASFRANLTTEARAILGLASKAKHSGWYKSISDMEVVARDIVAPDMQNCAAPLKTTIAGVFKWITDGSR